MHVKDIHRRHEETIKLLKTPEARCNRLVELNILEQIHKLSHLPIIQAAWKNLHAPTLHGWVYDMKDGRIHELLTLTPDHVVETIYSYRDIQTDV